MMYFILGIFTGLFLGYKHEIKFSIKKYSGKEQMEEVKEEKE